MIVSDHEWMKQTFFSQRSFENEKDLFLLSELVWDFFFKFQMNENFKATGAHMMNMHTSVYFMFQSACIVTFTINFNVNLTRECLLFSYSFWERNHLRFTSNSHSDFSIFIKVCWHCFVICPDSAKCHGGWRQR